MTENISTLQATLRDLPEGTPLSHELFEWLIANSVGGELHQVTAADAIQKLISTVVSLEIRLARLEKR